jgi:hypothetical protein
MPLRFLAYGKTSPGEPRLVRLETVPSSALGSLAGWLAILACRRLPQGRQIRHRRERFLLPPGKRSRVDDGGCSQLDAWLQTQGSFAQNLVPKSGRNKATTRRRRASLRQEGRHDRDLFGKPEIEMLDAVEVAAAPLRQNGTAQTTMRDLLVTGWVTRRIGSVKAGALPQPFRTKSPANFALS